MNRWALVVSVTCLSCAQQRGIDDVIPTGGAAFGRPSFATCQPNQELIPSAPFQDPERLAEAFVVEPALLDGLQVVQVQMEIGGLGVDTHSNYPPPNLHDNVAALFLEPVKEVSSYETFCGGLVCGFIDDLLGGGGTPRNDDTPSSPPITPISAALLDACPNFSPSAIFATGTALIEVIEVVRVDGTEATHFLSSKSGDLGDFTPVTWPLEHVRVTWADGWPAAALSP